MTTPAAHFAFALPASRVGRAVLRAIGVGPGAGGVSIVDGRLTVAFGPWRLRTSTANVAGAEVGGPYSAWRALGARLSLADRGVTFGSCTEAGVCIRFHRPVPAIEPFGLLRHPAVTVTVERPAELAARLNSGRPAPG